MMVGSTGRFKNTVMNLLKFLSPRPDLLKIMSSLTHRRTRLVKNFCLSNLIRPDLLKRTSTCADLCHTTYSACRQDMRRHPLYSLFTMREVSAPTALNRLVGALLLSMKSQKVIQPSRWWDLSNFIVLTITAHAQFPRRNGQIYI